MSFSSAVIVAILFFCIAEASALVIPDGKTVESENSNEFKVHITERGTKYVEKISVDEENDLEYFHVPSHNGLTEADYLYDFRSNISVRREKSKASCYLGPLPDGVPKPSDLKAGLQRESEVPSNRKITVEKYWIVSEEVDKTLLRQEVQDFCDQFPVFSTKEVDLSSLKANIRNSRDPGRTRLERKIDLSTLVFCDRKSMPQKPCDPYDWIYTFKIVEKGTCVYFVGGCKFSTQSKSVCEKWNHLYTRMVCYKIRCP